MRLVPPTRMKHDLRRRVPERLPIRLEIDKLRMPATKIAKRDVARSARKSRMLWFGDDQSVLLADAGLVGEPDLYGGGLDALLAPEYGPTRLRPSSRGPSERGQ
jgi:hypothetical protein